MRCDRHPAVVSKQQWVWFQRRMTTTCYIFDTEYDEKGNEVNSGSIWDLIREEKEEKKTNIFSLSNVNQMFPLDCNVNVFIWL